jgi:hypothetical protein
MPPPHLTHGDAQGIHRTAATGVTRYHTRRPHLPTPAALALAAAALVAALLANHRRRRSSSSLVRVQRPAPAVAARRQLPHERLVTLTQHNLRAHGNATRRAPDVRGSAQLPMCMGGERQEKPRHVRRVIERKKDLRPLPGVCLTRTTTFGTP